MAESQKTKLAREVRERFPDTPTLTLAKKLSKEHFETFLGVEDARNSLRYIEGKRGSHLKKKLADKSLVKNEDRPRNPFKLPKSYAKGRKHIDIKGKKILILSDIHIPYHDIDALSTADCCASTGCTSKISFEIIFGVATTLDA